MSRVIALRELRRLPDGFRERWQSRNLNRGDVAGLRLLGIRPADVKGIRRERRGPVHRTRRSLPVVPLVPRSRAEAQLLNFFRKQDEFHGFKLWPRRFQKMAISIPKRNHERFLFAMFLLLMGLNPESVRDWVLAGGVENVGGSLRPVRYSQYGANADRQISFILDRARRLPAWLSSYSRIIGQSPQLPIE